MWVQMESSRLAAWGAHGGFSGNWGEARPSTREQWRWQKALLPDTPQHHRELQGQTALVGTENSRHCCSKREREK